MIRAHILNRDLSTVLFTEEQIAVERVSLAMFGGLVGAELTLPFAGAEDEYLGLIGKYVEIWDDEGGKWIGLVNDVRVPYGSLALRASLDEMYNSIKVVSAIGMENVETDWIEDTVSIANYGRKQRMLTVSEKTLAEANTLAGKYLSERKSPLVGIDLAGMGRDEVTLGVIGLMQTLDWVYYRNDKGYEGYTDTGSGGREIGEDDRPKLAMGIMLGSSAGWEAKKVRVRLWKYPESNPPTDNVLVKLCADSSGVPGTVLATVTYSASEIGASSNWLEKSFASAVNLSPNTRYWLTAERSGSVDATKYFMLDTNTNNGYERGELYLWYTAYSQWRPAAHKGDLNFELIGMANIHDLIGDLVTQCGQFLSGVEFWGDFSSVETTVFRAGNNTALYELKELLKLTSSRSTAVVSETRKMVCSYVPSEPAADVDYYYLTDNGLTIHRGAVYRRPKFGYYLLQGATFRKSFLPVELEYSTGKWRIVRVAGMANVFEVGEVY